MEALFHGLDITQLDVDKEPSATKINEAMVAKDSSTKWPWKILPCPAPAMIILDTPNFLALEALVPIDP